MSANTANPLVFLVGAGPGSPGLLTVRGAEVLGRADLVLYDQLVPERLLELQTGESYGPSDDALSGIEFPINPERVAPVLRGLVSPTKTRARIYDQYGYLILDSRNLYIPGEVLRFDLPPPPGDQPNMAQRAWNSVRMWIGRGDLPLYREYGAEGGKNYPEVAGALLGHKESMVRITDRGEVVVSVALPIQRFRAVRGSLLLSTQGGDIDQAVEAERLQIAKLFFILLGVMVILSVLLAGTIAGPVKRLSESADRVRNRIRSRVEIPDFSSRRDEIGNLSRSLRDMTNALYTRIEAIESFAADVAHELCAPLSRIQLSTGILEQTHSPAALERLERESFVRLPLGDAFLPYAEGRFETPSGKFEFGAESLEYRAPQESRGRDARYGTAFGSALKKPGASVQISRRRASSLPAR